jgi:iron complex transport system ATP-binding protein
MIELKELECAFNGRVILGNISLKIDSHITVLGANGSGKSTLAKAICDLVAFSGTISIEGKKTQEYTLNERAKLLSYIPAKLEIYDPYITVEEFVLLGRFPHKESLFDYSEKDKNITLQTLEFLNIVHLKENPVSSLSSGEQQLILIAQALAQQSKIIIFDEPTANLDPHNAKIIAQHIKGLKEWHQIILITHDLHLACYVDSPVLFIKDKTAAFYERDFFDDAKLEELYGVAFNSLAVKYV